MIYPDDGVSYTCTLSVNGKFDSHKEVSIRISGDQGFTVDPMTLSANQGGSAKAQIKGYFDDPEDDPV